MILVPVEVDVHREEFHFLNQRSWYPAKPGKKRVSVFFLADEKQIFLILSMTDFPQRRSDRVRKKFSAPNVTDHTRSYIDSMALKKINILLS